jgi:hypothetical protein
MSSCQKIDELIPVSKKSDELIPNGSVDLVPIATKMRFLTNLFRLELTNLFRLKLTTLFQWRCRTYSVVPIIILYLVWALESISGVKS